MLVRHRCPPIRRETACTAPTRGSHSRAQVCRSRSGHQPTGRPWLCVLFDHFIGAYQEGFRNDDAEHPGGFEIDKQFELGGLFNRQVSRLCSLQYPVYITRGAAKKVGIARTITHQASVLGKSLKEVHGGQPVLVSEIDCSFSLTEQDRVCENDKSLYSRLFHGGKCIFQPDFG